MKQWQKDILNFSWDIAPIVLAAIVFFLGVWNFIDFLKDKKKVQEILK